MLRSMGLITVLYSSHSFLMWCSNRLLCPWASSCLVNQYLWLETRKCHFMTSNTPNQLCPCQCDTWTIIYTGKNGIYSQYRHGKIIATATDATMLYKFPWVYSICKKLYTAWSWFWLDIKVLINFQQHQLWKYLIVSIGTTYSGTKVMFICWGWCFYRNYGRGLQYQCLFNNNNGTFSAMGKSLSGLCGFSDTWLITWRQQ